MGEWADIYMCNRRVCMLLSDRNQRGGCYSLVIFQGLTYSPGARCKLNYSFGQAAHDLFDWGFLFDASYYLPGIVQVIIF